MMRRMNVVLTAAAALALSAAPLSAQWGIFGQRSDQITSRDMPPRGMCRVWIDGVSRSSQPRPTDCRTAERQRAYYEQRYRRNARVLYGDRSNDRYGVYSRNGSNDRYGVRDRNGSNCRYVERVIGSRVIRQRVCDENGVYDRNGRVYDRNGRVYDRNGNVVYRRDNRRNDRDSDSDDAKHNGKHKRKGNGRGHW